jgi:hypothetical protein
MDVLGAKSHDIFKRFVKGHELHYSLAFFYSFSKTKYF